MKSNSPKEIKKKILYCDKNCKCICHQTSYPLPKDFWTLIAGVKVDKPFVIKLRKGNHRHITISEVKK